MKRKNRNQPEVLLDVKTRADVKKIAKTYKGVAELYARWFGLGAGICSLIYGAVHRPFELVAIEMGVLLIAGGILIPWAMSVRYANSLKRQIGTEVMELEYKFYENMVEIYSRFKKSVKLSSISYEDVMKVKRQSFGLAVQLKNKSTYFLFLNPEEQKQAEEMIKDKAVQA